MLLTMKHNWCIIISEKYQIWNIWNGNSIKKGVI